MTELVKEGKVKYLGLSEAWVNTLERVSAVHSISAIQSKLSLWSRHLETDIYPHAKDWVSDLSLIVLLAVVFSLGP